jgi:hypothetical protein
MTAKTDYPECSGDPACCPENEGYGCCKPNPILRAAAGADVAGLMGLALTMPPRSARDERDRHIAALESALRVAIGAKAGDDDVFEALDLSPETFRTEGGAVNVGKLRAAIKHPADYLAADHWLSVAMASKGWIEIPEGGMPPLGEQVLVWCKCGPHWGPMVDCWDEQHEAPVSFSSATIPIGPGWDSGSDFYDVTHWMRIGSPVAASQAGSAQEPQPPSGTTIKQSEWQGLSPGAQDRLRQAIDAKHGRYADALANFPRTPLAAQEPKP